MIHHEQTRTAGRRPRWTLIAGLVAIIAAVIGVLAYPSLAASSSPVTSPSGTPPAAHPGARHGPAGQADGVVSDGVTIFSSDVPAVTRLDPALLSALRRAATDAGIQFYVNSGWRSKGYQEQLLQEAIAKYGSKQKAAHWVAPADSSAHVSGDAVDLGHSDATSWLSQHGAAYGLCQIYGNESWHYELRPEAVLNGCPDMYADATHDPRMQQ
jgi:D-alanyl-D-alanine carboxypeptidase